ncbi:MAG: GFA family protein [Caulobacteraceae bacterium]|nr:GFA family protein [Caulobacteraceae bacterium]
MRLEGGCYCKGLRYVAEGEPMMKAQCHCRECQYLTGGGPNIFIAMPIAGFSYTKGEPKSFTRTDLEHPVTREFCPTCGTHITTRPQGFPAVIIKVGTLDDPTQFEGPDFAIYTIDKQAYHEIPAGLRTFERLPG